MGVCVAALREFRERGFRTGEQVRAELGLEFLGMLPEMKATTRKPLFGKSIFARKSRRRALEAGSIDHEKLAPVMRYAVDQPLSAFAETLRAVKIAADLTLPDRATRVLGVTSVLPGEGKSTIAMNFASLLSNLGNRTLLIDGDLRNPGLTRAVAPDAKAGLIEAVLEGKPFKSLLVKEQASSLSILPAVLHGRVPHTSDFLVSVRNEGRAEAGGGRLHLHRHRPSPGRAGRRCTGRGAAARRDSVRRRVGRDGPHARSRYARRRTRSCATSVSVWCSTR